MPGTYVNKCTKPNSFFSTCSKMAVSLLHCKYIVSNCCLSLYWNTAEQLSYAEVLEDVLGDPGKVSWRVGTRKRAICLRWLVHAMRLMRDAQENVSMVINQTCTHIPARMYTRLRVSGVVLCSTVVGGFLLQRWQAASQETDLRFFVLRFICLITLAKFSQNTAWCPFSLRSCRYC